jgi:hypothetical protein
MWGAQHPGHLHARQPLPALDTGEHGLVSETPAL